MHVWLSKYVPAKWTDEIFSFRFNLVGIRIKKIDTCLVGFIWFDFKSHFNFPFPNNFKLKLFRSDVNGGKCSSGKIVKDKS